MNWKRGDRQDLENKRAIGTEYEKLAGKFLEQHGYEILTYNNLLFSDAYKQQITTFEVDSSTVAMDSSINVYELISFNDNFDLYIGSLIELNNLSNYVKNFASNSSYYKGNTNHNSFTIEVAIDKSSSITVGTLCSYLKVYTYIQLSAEGDINSYVFVINF